MKKHNPRESNIKDLEELADEVMRLKQKRELRRPLLIEFCGSPKSGKSTTISSLNTFLKRNGFKTEVLFERSSVCPVSSKTHPFFNIWTLTSAIAEIIKHFDQGIGKVDVLISDRGIFDALCWFEWLNQNPSENSPYLDDIAYKDLKTFIFMKMWSSILDVIYVFKVSPETSIKREYANLLTDKRGSIMRENVLEGFNISTNRIIEKYSKHFNKVIEIKTDISENENHPSIVSYNVTHNILTTLKDILIEKIGYFPHDLTKALNEGLNQFEVLDNEKLFFGNRDEVEKQNFIQPVAIAVVTNKKRNKVLVVKKNPKRLTKKSPESEKLLLYIGGHVRQEDDRGEILKVIIEKALHREIQEEIGESISIKNSEPFLIYSTDMPKSEKHLAICYIIEMDLEDKKFKLTSDEFVMKTGPTKSGHVQDINELRDGNNKFESWSKLIFKYVFEKNLEPTLFT